MLLKYVFYCEDSYEKNREKDEKNDINNLAIVFCIVLIFGGIIKDGQISYKVYGENGKELSAELHTYEIGSLTKTFTAALINKAIQEDKINIDCTIDKYLSLPEGNTYPTIKELLTHTSGYKGYSQCLRTISLWFIGISLDVELIFNISCKNQIFYQYHPPFVTRESIVEDMEALPPGKSYDDKYYVGFFENESCKAFLIILYNNVLK